MITAVRSSRGLVIRNGIIPGLRDNHIINPQPGISTLFIPTLHPTQPLTFHNASHSSAKEVSGGLSG